MMMAAFRFWALLASLAAAQSSSSSSSPSCQTLTPTSSIQPSVASGYQVGLVATGLTKPRSIEFDASGNLLVVQVGKGLASLQLQDDGGTCVSVKGQKMLVQDGSLNHGLALALDGKTVYASNSEAVYAWDYNAADTSISGSNRTLINGMSTDDHTTRTLFISQKEPGLMLVSRGSTSNLDYAAESLSSGHSQIRAFNLTNKTGTPYKFTTDGLRLGWGLRNSVGVAEHPNTGGIYSVENSADNIQREGQDIHEDNPGEEMNFHGYLNGTAYDKQGSNYGYPTCFSAWVPSDIPQNNNLSVGSPFSIGNQNTSLNDTICADTTTPATLTFQAHMAPLDIKFNNSGTEAWVTYHGSWDRTDPSGYKLSVIAFDGPSGTPLAKPDNNTSLQDVFANSDNGNCPDNCFRPVGMAFDSQGRLFMSSDASGEIYVITRAQGAPSTSANSSSGGKTKSSAVQLLRVNFLHIFLGIAVASFILL